MPPAEPALNDPLEPLLELEGVNRWYGTQHALKDVTFHKADPSIALVLLGWKCGGCGLIGDEREAAFDSGLLADDEWHQTTVFTNT